MSEDDINSIAAKLVEKIKSREHSFWIDPESHYQDHRTIQVLKSDEVIGLKQMLEQYKTASNIFWRAFIGFAIVGSIVMAAIGFYSQVKGAK